MSRSLVKNEVSRTMLIQAHIHLLYRVKLSHYWRGPRFFLDLYMFLLWEICRLFPCILRLVLSLCLADVLPVSNILSVSTFNK